jgi:hypothetical protein
MTMFNELMVSVYLYLLLCLSSADANLHQRDVVSWVLVAVVMFTVAVNLCKAMYVDACYLKRLILKKMRKG